MTNFKQSRLKACYCSENFSKQKHFYIPQNNSYKYDTLRLRFKL